MRVEEQCQTATCRQTGTTVTSVAERERRWDLLLCDEHADRVEDGDETHVLTPHGRPLLTLGPVLVGRLDRGSPH